MYLVISFKKLFQGWLRLLSLTTKSLTAYGLMLINWNLTFLYTWVLVKSYVRKLARSSVLYGYIPFPDKYVETQCSG